MAPSAMPLATAFDPATDGFKFSNNDVKWEWPHPGGPHGSNLCGGMVYAALDYFKAGKTIPPDTTPPAIRTPLNSYITSRQLAAHVRTVPRLTGGTVLFLASPDWYVDSLASEFDAIRKKIAGGEPVPLFVVRTAAFTGHHVLVIGCQSSPSLGNPILDIYDPNRPNDVSAISVDYAAKRFNNKGPSTTGDGMVLKGYFVDNNYSPHQPPP